MDFEPRQTVYVDGADASLQTPADDRGVGASGLETTMKDRTRLTTTKNRWATAGLVAWTVFLTSPFVPALAQTELITNGDFSLGSTGWTLIGDFHADRKFQACRSCLGHAYASNRDGSPGNNLYAAMRQDLTIPADARSAALSFWYQIKTEETGPAPADVMVVLIVDSTGTILEVKTTLSNANASPAYAQRTLDLTAYKGQTIGLKFLATTDTARPTAFLIDDVSVVASASATPPPAVTPPVAQTRPVTSPTISVTSTPLPIETRAATNLLAPTVTGSSGRVLSGKGDWIHRLDSALANLGLSSLEGLLEHEKARGIEWLVVKCADANNHSGWRSLQFNSELIAKCRAAGMKILGYHFIFGGNPPANYPNPSSVPGEIQAALEALSLQPDGLVIDWEIEFEGLGEAAAVAAAEQYCQGIRARYPNTLLAHAPIWKPSVHRPNIYKMFNKYCDVAMPQAYCSQYATPSETWLNPVRPSQMVTLMNNDWLNVSATWLAESIRPLAPIIWGAPPTTAAEISEFVSSLKAVRPPASPGGYGAVSFWSAQHHTPDIWSGIAAVSIGAPAPQAIPVVITTAPAGLPITVDGIGYPTTPQSFQWAPGSQHSVSTPAQEGASETRPSITIQPQRASRITISVDGETPAARANLP